MALIVLSVMRVLALKMLVLILSLPKIIKASAAVMLASLILTPEPIKLASPLEMSDLALASVMVLSDRRAVSLKVTPDKADSA